MAKAVERKIAIYRSPNLKEWTHLSDFGPANATGGVWECPDLFPLAVDGKRKKTKWVMIVSLNPGAIAGGSGTQYFVGDFDGTTFTADNEVGEYTPPQGDLFEGFEGSTYGAWTTTGDAFGGGPAAGNVPPQGGVSGYLGSGLANSFHGEDRATGTLTSPSFHDQPPLHELPDRRRQSRARPGHHRRSGAGRDRVRRLRGRRGLRGRLDRDRHVRRNDGPPGRSATSRRLAATRASSW